MKLKVIYEPIKNAPGVYGTFYNDPVTGDEACLLPVYGEVIDVPDEAGQKLLADHPEAYQEVVEEKPIDEQPADAPEVIEVSLPSKKLGGSKKGK